MISGDMLPNVAIDTAVSTAIDRHAAFPFLWDYAVVLVLAVAATVMVAAVTRGEWARASLNVLLPAAALGATGITIGILVGNSLTPIASAALSGLLSIGSGFVVYLVSKDEVPPWSRVGSAVALVAVSTALVYGASVASSYRGRFEERDALAKAEAEQVAKRFAAQVAVWEYTEKKRIDLVADSVMKAHAR